MSGRALVRAAVVLALAPGLIAPSVLGERPGPEASPSGDILPAAWSPDPAPVAPVRTDGACAPTDSPPTRTASLVAGSAWSWYQDPRVLTTRRATHVSSVRNNGDIQVTSVDRGTARLRHAVVQPAFEPDDHNAPSLTELDDGRIVAFWSAHGTVPAHYRVTLASGDITTFGPALTLSGSGLEGIGATYTSIVHLPGNERPYHLFTRRAGDDAWVLTTSADLLSWTPAVRLFAHDDPRSYPYAKFIGTGWNTIHMVVSDTTARPGERSSLYHLSLSDGVFRRSDGTVIRSLSEVAGGGSRPTHPIAPREGTRIYDGWSADGRARPYDIAVLDGDPVVVFTTGDRWSSTWTQRWMRRRGETWVSSTLLRSSEEPQGLTLRHDDPTRVLLVRDGDLEEYRTCDDGRSWTRRTVGPPGAARTPAAPRSTEGGPVSAAWLQGHYEGFRHGRWTTTVMIETTDPAPLDLSVRWPTNWSRVGASLGARVTAGVNGPPVEGRSIWVLVTRPGGDEERLIGGRTDPDGSVDLPVDPGLPVGTRVRVSVPQSTEWGLAVSPPRVVPGPDQMLLGSSTAKVSH